MMQPPSLTRVTQPPPPLAQPTIVQAIPAPLPSLAPTTASSASSSSAQQPVPPPPQQPAQGSIIVQLDNGNEVSISLAEGELQRRWNVHRGMRLTYFTGADQVERSGVVEGFFLLPSPRVVVRREDGKYEALTNEALEFSIRHHPTTTSSNTAAVDTASSPRTPSTPGNQPPQQPARSYHDLRNKTKLGEGAQGVVYKCVTPTGEEVVSKEMYFSARDAEEYRQRLEQVRSMQKLSHRHLIQYLDVQTWQNPDRSFTIAVIMPFYKESDLSSVVKRTTSPIEENLICSLCLQVAQALHYLHNQRPPLVHRDVKPDNILMCQQGERALLMDLDTCKAVSTPMSVVQRATEEYRAPELRSSSGTPKSDMWSLGVVMFVLAALPDFPMLECRGSTITLNSSDWTDALLSQAVRRAIAARNPRYSERFAALICSLLCHDDKKRPSAADTIIALNEISEDNLLGQSRPLQS